VSAGARLDRISSTGYTPLALNVSTLAKSEIAALLVYHGARTDIRHTAEGPTILAKCIMTMRLDCESLAVLMVQVGGVYSHGSGGWSLFSWFRWVEFFLMVQVGGVCSHGSGGWCLFSWFMYLGDVFMVQVGFCLGGI